MATNTPNLKIPKPDGNEYFNRQNINNILDVIDQNAASKEDVSNIDLSKLATKEEVNTVNSALTSHKNENATEHQRLAIEDLRLRNLNNNLQREVAYLKLKQEANERIEGGTTFADDMNDNRFGVTFDETNSENIVIRDGSMLMLKREKNEHTVNDASIIGGTSFNLEGSSRKLVRLSNGWLVAAFDAGSDIFLYKSTNNGVTWDKLKNGGSSAANVSIASYGNNICVLTTNESGSNLSVYARVINVITDTIIGDVNAVLDTSQTSINSSTLIVNEAGTEIHAAWSSVTSNYIYSYNIRYVKGTINADGSVAWGTVEQVTKNNSNDKNVKKPSILVNKNDEPVILTETSFTNDSNRYFIGSIRKDKNTGKWIGYNGTLENELQIVYSGGITYAQLSPSAIFVPQSINGLTNGRIWVAWNATDSTDASQQNIRVSYSDDSGVTWSAMQKITSGNATGHVYPSLTATKDGKLYIVCYANETNYPIKQLTYNGSWSSPITIKNGGGFSYPSTLFDLSLSISSPLFIYKDIINSKVGFNGAWIIEVDTPFTTATAIYDLPSTDYVGTFVKKEGNVNIDAYINDVVMDKSLENDEYMFTKDLPSEAPIKLRLELSRDNISGGNNDKVTRILGGIA